jgi:hypothetical protein
MRDSMWHLLIQAHYLLLLKRANIHFTNSAVNGNRTAAA